MQAHRDAWDTPAARQALCGAQVCKGKHWAHRGVPAWGANSGYMVVGAISGCEVEQRPPNWGAAKKGAWEARGVIPLFLP